MVLHLLFAIQETVLDQVLCHHPRNALKPDCGDPTEPQAPDRRHNKPQLPSPFLQALLRLLGQELLDLGHLVLVWLVLVRPVPRQLPTPPPRTQRCLLTSCRHACRSGSGERQTRGLGRGPCR